MVNDSLLTNVLAHRLAAEQEEPKEPRTRVVDWFNRAPGLPNDTEVLFLALLVAARCEPVSEVTSWAARLAACPPPLLLPPPPPYLQLPAHRLPPLPPSFQPIAWSRRSRWPAALCGLPAHATASAPQPLPCPCPPRLSLSLSLRLRLHLHLRMRMRLPLHVRPHPHPHSTAPHRTTQLRHGATARHLNTQSPAPAPS